MVLVVTPLNVPSVVVVVLVTPTKLPLTNDALLTGNDSLYKYMVGLPATVPPPVVVAPVTMVLFDK